MSDFTQVFRDDFSGNGLNYDIWKAQYSGQYGNGMFRWDPAQLEVSDGKLTIATEQEGDGWVSGGLSTIPEGQTYGSYEFRARMDPGQGTASAILLWPSNNQWTDEVDIIETNKPGRESFAFTNHGDPNVTKDVGVDVSQWHDYRLDWTPGSLTLYVDGVEKSHIDVDVPAQDMSFGMQGMVMAAHEHWFGGGPDGSTPGRVETEVDWVKVSAWTPGAGTETETAAPASEVQAPVQEAAATEEVAAASSAVVAEASAAAAETSSDPWAQFMVGGQVDWNAAAAHVSANYEATGQWFI
jgi:beta-glucanase (GH16 family)